MNSVGLTHSCKGILLYKYAAYKQCLSLSAISPCLIIS